MPQPSFNVSPPPNVRAGARMVGKGYVLALSWDSHRDEGFKIYGTFEIQFKNVRRKAWRAGPVVNGNRLTADVVASKMKQKWDVRLRSVNSFGVPSSWVTLNRRGFDG